MHFLALQPIPCNSMSSRASTRGNVKIRDNIAIAAKKERDIFA
jgi:hypothetical protein